MEKIDTSLFLLINASGHPDSIWLGFARLFGVYAIWIVPVMLVAGWLRGDERSREWAVEATASGLVALVIGQLIGLVWQHPRPFMLGLGRTLVPHVADSSFPSDHLSLLWAVSFSFLVSPKLRSTGIALALIGLPMAWARIYVGLHFPLDIAGSAIVAAMGAGLSHFTARWYARPIVHRMVKPYMRIFAPFIRRGWVLK